MQSLTSFGNRFYLKTVMIYCKKMKNKENEVGSFF